MEVPNNTIHSKGKKQKLIVLVASHKPDKVYCDEVYSPIHVGRAISPFKTEMVEMIGDDTGDNISAKNKTYCELTATYWAWKNLKDVEYVGLAHYRRYFETRFTNKNIDEVFRSCDVVLAEPYLNDRYNEIKMARTLTMEDEAIFLLTLKRLFPDYEQTTIDYLFGFKDIAYNMFVMHRSTFEHYCEFTFSILQECERLMRPLPYTCSMRRLGYIGEYLLPIFCIHNKLRIRTETVVPFIGEHTTGHYGWMRHLKIQLLKCFYNKHKPKTIESMVATAVQVGLKADDINI